MQDKVDAKIQEMLAQGIIEPAIGQTEWISPMVVVPKGKDDIRLCINMKFPNQAIQREHYPLPLIDTLLNKLKGAKYFSNLYTTSAFYHIELHPVSRGITTFMTNRGLMRFTRLMFGINCAPEIFNRYYLFERKITRPSIETNACSTQNHLDVLGYNVSADGISPSDSKIDAISNFRTPVTKKKHEVS
uniref:Reverse transcriptase domain-containing protein n=1 Tax=Anopheles stephensi TaxID=30069 RepID=A0A182YRU0_ANOST